MMMHCFFGQFLLQQGLVSEADLSRCALLQGRSNLLLGEMAIQLGFLSEIQAADINQRQTLEDKRFGDIAVEQGLLHSAQVEKLLSQQKLAHQFLGEILVAEGVITEAQLLQQLQLHRQEREATLSDFHCFISEHPLESAVTAAISLVQKLFLRSLKSQCHFGCYFDPGSTSLPLHSACVRLNLQPAVSLGIACDDDSLRRIAARFVSLEPASCDRELCLDALGELVNILAGHLLNDSGMEKQLADMGTPIIGRASDLIYEARQQPIMVKMDSLVGGFVLLIWKT